MQVEIVEIGARRDLQTTFIVKVCPVLSHPSIGLVISEIHGAHCKFSYLPIECDALLTWHAQMRDSVTSYSFLHPDSSPPPTIPKLADAAMIRRRPGTASVFRARRALAQARARAFAGVAARAPPRPSGALEHLSGSRRRPLAPGARAGSR